jgi:hypothetical protein
MMRHEPCQLQAAICPISLLVFWQFAGAGREQAERSSGKAAKQAVPMPERRRQGSSLPADKKINTATLSGPESHTLPEGEYGFV